MALTPAQLETLDAAREVRIETRRGNRAFQTIIWIVVAGDEVYVRSVRAGEGAWYRRALSDSNVVIHVDDKQIPFRAVHVFDEETIDRVSVALRAKYPPGGSLQRMTRSEVLDTTLRLDPVD